MAAKLVATELVSGQALVLQVAGAQVKVSFTLLAATCYVVRLAGRRPRRRRARPGVISLRPVRG